MALDFTDDQIKKISNDILGLPAVIQGFQDQKADLLVVKADLQKADEQNTVFSDNFIGIVGAYHDELVPLKGDQRTDYLAQDIIDGANKSNDHFPQTWTKFQPQLIDKNNGIPIASGNPVSEPPRAKAEETIDLFKNGFTDGATSDTLAEAYIIGQPLEVTSGGFAGGQRVVVEGGGQALLAIIDSVGALAPYCTGEDNPPQLDQVSCEADNGTWVVPTGVQALTITPLSDPNVVLPAGSTVKNFHPGFNNTERESSDTTGFLGVMKSQVDTDVAAYKPFVETQKTALEANDDTGSDGTQNASALATITDIFDKITAFETAPASGAGVGKYGDTVLGPLETLIIARAAQIAPRIAEIEASLGSVLQNPDGTFSGVKRYFDLFKWVDLRINIASGSLRKLLDADLGVEFFDQSITGAQNQQSEYENIFLVKQFSVDGDASEFVELSDVTGLAISDTVFVMDNDSAVITRTISDIQGNVVELNSAVGVTLALDKLARLVKRL